MKTGPNQGKGIAMCLFLLETDSIVAIAKVLVVYSLHHKPGPVFSKSGIRKVVLRDSGFVRD